MKKLPLCFLLLLTRLALAQNFEGTIQWSMKMDITDPAMKAKMAESQAKMNDPANQARMKEMQAKMNDPQMKAMMESNPQMKAHMENMMKMSQGGDMMPKGFTVKVKGKNVVTRMEGGPMAMEILYNNDKNQTYRMDRPNKTFSVVPESSHGQGTPTTNSAKVTKTGETTKILNYVCTKYLVEVQEGGRTVNQSIWTTTDIKDIDMKNLAARQKAGRSQSIFYDGMEGVPLRIESSTPEGKMTMEVTEIKRETLSAADFLVPSDFKETPMMGRP